MRANTNSERVQTAFRLNSILLSRVREAARRNKISVNDYVSRTLAEATEDILSPEEEAEAKKHTNAFLAAVGGSWSGPETSEDIMRSIKEGNGVKDIVEL